MKIDTLANIMTIGGGEKPTPGLISQIDDSNAGFLLYQFWRTVYVKITIATLSFVVVLSSPAFADVEKVAQMCDEQICFHWWPKLPSIKGWHQDRENSLHYNFNALAPIGRTFSDAETVMYADAVYKPRVPEKKTLSTFIDGDLQKFRNDNPGLKIAEEPPLKTGDGKVVRLFRFNPSTQGQWERAAYLEEGDFYIDFVISSRSEKGLSDSSAAYEALIASYREKL